MTLRKCLGILMLFVSGWAMGQAWLPNTDGVETIHNGEARVEGLMKAHHFQPDFGCANNGTQMYPGYLFATGSAIASPCVAGSPNVNGVDFWSGWNVRMSLSAAGRLGIGVRSPEAYMHVVTTASTTPALKLQNTTGGANAKVGIDFLTYQGPLNSNLRNARIEAIDMGGFMGALALSTKGANADVEERMRIDHNGRVGIGMRLLPINPGDLPRDPEGMLHVVTSTTTGACVKLQNRSGAAQQNVGIDFQPMPTLNTSMAKIEAASNTSAKADLVFSTLTTSLTSPAERLRITHDGNIAIGSPTIPTGYKMFVNGNTIQSGQLVVSNAGGGLGVSYMRFASENSAGLITTVTKPLLLNSDGVNYVGIGYNNAVQDPGLNLSADYRLRVKGKIICEELKVKLSGNWPDYVFEEDYKLASLDSLESFINENKHLPEVPSAAEVKENGIETGQMNAILLKKVEELTLYMIQQQKEIEALKAKNVQIEKQLIK